MPHSPTPNCCAATSSVIQCQRVGSGGASCASRDPHEGGRSWGSQNKVSTLGNEPRAVTMEDLMGAASRVPCCAKLFLTLAQAAGKCGELESYSGFLRI